jgi:hypothetical protein
MYEALATINKLANERAALYRLAGHQRLSEDQVARVKRITDELAVQWDLHRREVTAVHISSGPRVVARPAAAVQRMDKAA